MKTAVISKSLSFRGKLCRESGIATRNLPGKHPCPREIPAPARMIVSGWRPVQMPVGMADWSAGSEKVRLDVSSLKSGKHLLKIKRNH